MSRHRRGVVHSDDESTVPRPSKRARQSNPRNDQPIDDTILNLPNVTKLPPDQVAKIRLLENDGHTLKQRILQAMVVISDAAVAVQELDKTEHDEDVESLEKTLLRLIDASLHVDHATESYDRTCKASETSADAVPFPCLLMLTWI
jgi:hypothetical protein